MARRAHGAAQPVHERAMGLVLELIAPAARRMIDDVLGQYAGNGRCVAVGIDLGIQSHGSVCVSKKGKGRNQASRWMFCSLARRDQRSDRKSVCRERVCQYV